MTPASEPANRAALMEVYRHLDAMHAWRGWHWWPDADPFEVIVGAILVQNTAWANVERALDRLRSAGALTLDAVAALPPEQLEELVRPSGQYRQKARKLLAFLALVNERGGLDRLLSLPPDILRPCLLATWGIGPETADCILLYAARQPAFIVDAYLIRLCTRLGIGPVHTADYDTWQRFFESALPAERDLYARFRAEIVLHCKYLCRKRSPKCDECTLRPRCPGSPLATGASHAG
jgi:endonuclease-3 related protein